MIRGLSEWIALGVAFVLLILALAGCATPACPCLYGRPMPVEYVVRCGA